MGVVCVFTQMMAVIHQFSLHCLERQGEGPMFTWAGLVDLALPSLRFVSAEVCPSAASVRADSSSKDGERLYGPQDQSPAEPEPAEPGTQSRWSERDERVPEPQTQAGSERTAAEWDFRCGSDARVRVCSVGSGSDLSPAARHQQKHRPVQLRPGQVHFTTVQPCLLWYCMITIIIYHNIYMPLQ